MVNKISSRFLKGIFWGSTIFTLNVILLDGIALTFSPAFHAIGALLFGISLSLSELILESEQLHGAKRIVIYVLALAFSILTIGFLFGWFSTDSPSSILAYIAEFTIVYLGVWVLQYFFEKYQLKELSRALKENEREK